GDVVRQRQQRADAELPFEAQPDVDRNAEHGDAYGHRAALGELAADLARNGFDGVDAGLGIVGLDRLLDPGRGDVGRGFAACRLGQTDLEGLRTAEFLDARLAEMKPVDAAAQLLDVDRLGEGYADQLSADEIDAEIEAAIKSEADRARSGYQRQDQR